MHACTATSLLVVNSGMVAACTGVMRTNPKAATVANTGADNAGVRSAHRREGRFLGGAAAAEAEDEGAAAVVVLTTPATDGVTKRLTGGVGVCDGGNTRDFEDTDSGCGRLRFNSDDIHYEPEGV